MASELTFRQARTKPVIMKEDNPLARRDKE